MTAVTIIRGRVIRLGDDVNTDSLLAGRYLNLTDPAELGAHLLETYDGDAGARVRAGDILVAGPNFGSGSSREQAPVAIQARGIRAIVAASFARIFLRNAINLGLPVFECAAAAAALQDEERIEIDREAGTLQAQSGETFSLPPTAPFIRELLDAGGLVPWVRLRLGERSEGLSRESERSDRKLDS